jgi:hypothetical protein
MFACTLAVKVPVLAYRYCVGITSNFGICTVGISVPYLTSVWSGLCSTPSCPLGACRRLWGSALQVCSESCFLIFLLLNHACIWQQHFHFLFLSSILLVSVLICLLTLLMLFHVCDELFFVSPLLSQKVFEGPTVRSGFCRG